MANLPFVLGSKTEAEILLQIHKHEESLLAGPGSNKKDIHHVLWCVHDVMPLMPDGVDESLVLNVISTMIERNEIMVVPSGENDPLRYITRTAETIRLLGHTYEYWHQGRPGIDALRWIPERKKIPVRNLSHTDFKGRLLAEIIVPEEAQEDFDIAVEDVIDGMAELLGGGDPAKAGFSEFQYRATRASLLAHFANEDQGAEVLSAGVGSGKTIGFMFPILILSRFEELRGIHVSRLVLYPRTALANDQYDTVVKYVEASNLQPSAGHSEMRYSQTHPSAARGIRAVHETAPRPRIIISTMETLKRRLQNPDFVKHVMPTLQHVVIDEIHLISGAQGAHVAYLMRRMQALSRHPIHWVGSSATIASPEDHAGRIFNVSSKSVEVIEPSETELVFDGIQNHVFLRPSGLISNLGALVNITSLVMHARRDDLADRPNTDLQIEKSSKTIGFADNLDMLGRWKSDLMENERTENRPGSNSSDRSHPNQPTPQDPDWTRVQREIPYAARFQVPLQRRMCATGGVLPETKETALAPVLQDHAEKASTICRRCKNGERISLGSADLATMVELGKHVHRIQHHEDDAFKPFQITHDIFKTPQSEIGTLDLCPYLRAGACTWFSQSDPSLVSMIEGTENNKRYEYAAVGRSKIHSSKSEKSEGQDESLASEVFRDKVSNVYQLEHENGKRVSVDVVLASPSLEVGIDIPNLTESVMIKAVRNIASYRQKAGRVGRGTYMDALNVTLITDSPVDLHYYRQPRKLVSEGRLEAIPLKERNMAVMQCAIYQATWDWLALHSVLPEVIPRTWERAGVSDFRRRIERCVKDIQENRPDLRQHLRKATGNAATATPELLDSAIAQVQSELSVFLRSAGGTWVFSSPIPGEYTLADVLVRRLDHNTPPSLHPDVSEDVEALLSSEGDWLNLRGKRKRLNRLVRRGTLSQDLTRNVDLALGWCAPDVSEMTAVMESLEPHNEHSRVKDFIKAATTVVEDTQEYIDDGWDPIVHCLQKEYASITDWKATYFSTVRMGLTTLKRFRKNPWFVDPKTLFTNPYDEEVELMHSSLKSNQKFISVSEALHSFIPGNWTYRLPQSAYKVMSGQLDYNPASSIANLNLEQAEAYSSEFRKISTNLPAPPGLPEGMMLSVYAPVKLQLKKVKQKYINLNPEAGLLVDNDELPFGQGGHRAKPRKIPRSFNNRWTHFNARPGETVSLPNPAELGLGQLEVTTQHSSGGEEVHAGAAGASLIQHPLFGGHLASVEWHDLFDVTEFVYSSSRSYSTDAGFGKEIRFHDGLNSFALGQKFETEGLSIHLNDSTCQRTVHQIVSEMNAGAPWWTPTLISVFGTYLQQIPLNPPEERTLGHFETEDVLGVLIGLCEDGDVALTPEKLFDVFEQDLDDATIRSMAERRVKAMHGLDEESAPDGGIDPEDFQQTIDQIVMNIRLSREILRGKATVFAEEYLPLWLHRSILMSMGVTTVSALQQISGSQTSDIGYTIDVDSWKGEGHSIHLYDRCHHGNGSCRVGKEFLHIPNLLRHGYNHQSRLLPSTDFLSQIEEGLLQCMQHHSDVAALSLHEAGGEETLLVKALSDIKLHAHETLDVAGPHWSSMGIQSPNDAWRLAQKFKIRKELAIKSEIALDDLTRATRFCWNGCPECIHRLDIVLGGNYGMPFLDKAVLDLWYRNGRQSSNDYHDVNLDDLAAGTANLQFGITHNVTLDINDRRLRSSLLPWTIGLDIQRSDLGGGVGMLVRESDIHLHRSVEMTSNQDPIGVPSIGVKRLLWFDLVMTAYLDASGRLDPSNRTIDMVYYDIRDIEFEDVGLSPRMLDAVHHLGKEVGFTRFESLSDILAWLVYRGFTLRLCVDAGQAQQDGVRTFLKQLTDRSRGGSGVLDIMVKDIPYASMHKKILVTPIGGLMGSANLSESGTARSEEINAHVPRSSPNFQMLKRSCDDSFTHAQSWSE